MRKVLLGLGALLTTFTLSGCSTIARALIDDSIKQNQQVVLNELREVKRDPSLSKEAKEHIDIAEASASVVGSYIGEPGTPVPHDHNIAVQIQEEGQKAVLEGGESGVVSTLLGAVGSYFPAAAPFAAIAALLFQRARKYNKYFRAIVTGVHNAVKAGKEGNIDKNSLYQAISGAADVLTDLRGFATEVAKVKAEIKTKGSNQ